MRLKNRPPQPTASGGANEVATNARQHRRHQSRIPSASRARETRAGITTISSKYTEQIAARLRYRPIPNQLRQSKLQSYPKRNTGNQITIKVSLILSITTTSPQRGGKASRASRSEATGTRAREIFSSHHPPLVQQRNFDYYGTTDTEEENQEGKTTSSRLSPKESITTRKAVRTGNSNFPRKLELRDTKSSKYLEARV